MASRRGYLTQAELAQYADITITDTTEADDQISQAEELIDSYIGAQHKFLPNDVTGLVASAAADTFTLEEGYRDYDQDYFKGCEVQIIGGTGEGQTRTISGNGYNNGVVTISTSWTTTPDTTSYYRIIQLGKFPRYRDVEFFNRAGDPRVFKWIPENIKRATAAQVEYIVKMGTAFFTTNNTSITREQIGDYEYEKSGTGRDSLIAPKAQLLLRGYKNRIGYFSDGVSFE